MEAGLLYALFKSTGRAKVRRSSQMPPPIAPEARGCRLCMGQVKRLCGVAAGCGGALVRAAADVTAFDLSGALCSAV